MIDFNKFGKQGSYTPVADQGSQQPSTPGVNFSKFNKQGTYTPPAKVPQKEGTLTGIMKSIVSAPATMVARPVQLGAELLGASAEDVNKFTEKYTGGIVAPVPQNFSDVKKDVGRGVQTVALGVGSPMSAGAAFGFGTSLEQGNDVFSGETLKQTLIGLGAGKLLDVAGKPILDAAGKVIGAVTPKMLSDLAAGGSKAISEFMAKHEIAGGVLKPVTSKITAGAEAFDAGVNKAISGTKEKAASLFKGQYPDVLKKAQTHYENVETDRLMKPASDVKVFSKSREVAQDAQKRGIDLKQELKDNKIYASDLIEDGKFNTIDVADALANEAKSGGRDVFRPALAEADAVTERVPLSEIRSRMINKVKSAKPAQLSAQQKEDFIKKISTEYADDSATAQAFSDGYRLTDLYDSKLNTSSPLYSQPKTGGLQQISDSETAIRKKIESDVFGDLLKERAPKELGVNEYFKAQEKKFVLANYLRTLNGTKPHATLFQKGLKRASQLSGATVGAQTAGPFGMFSGYQFGGMMADTFAKAPNPVKVSFLKSVGKKQPEIYQIMKEYVSDKEALRLSGLVPRLEAPAPGGQPIRLFGESTIEKPAGVIRKHETAPAIPRLPAGSPNMIQGETIRLPSEPKNRRLRDYIGK